MMLYNAIRTRQMARRNRHGLTLVELLVAMTVLMILFTVVLIVLTTYLKISTNVVSTYNGIDNVLPTSTVIQQLIRAEVEPGPTVVRTVPQTNAVCPASSAPCPPFLAGSMTGTSATFFANIGDPNGPAKIVMSEGAPTECSNCSFYTSQFTITQYAACPALGTASATCPVNNGCPFTLASTNTCSWSSSGKQLVTLNGVVNGSPGGGTLLEDNSSPIFSYGLFDVGGNGYSGQAINPSASDVANGNITGLTALGYPTDTQSLGACAAPGSSYPTLGVACPPDAVQSVGVDFYIHVPGGKVVENAFTVYQTSSSSYQYSTLVG